MSTPERWKGDYDWLMSGFETQVYNCPGSDEETSVCRSDLDSWYENWSDGHELGEEEPRVSDAESDDMDDILYEVEVAKQSLQELLRQSSVVQPETVIMITIRSVLGSVMLVA